MRLFNRTPVPEGAAAGVAVGLPELGAGIPSALEQLLSKGRVRATLAMLGPAFVASIAYVDPGNFATNFAGGAQFGYLLLWVVLAANLIAMLIQYLSAKLGIATDRNLAENFRTHYPRVLTWGMWVQAEIVAMSTDIAEFPRRCDRPEPALRSAAVSRRPDDGRDRVRDPRAAQVRLPPL